MLASTVLTAKNKGCLALAAPPPVTCGSCRTPVPRTAVKQPKPSETSVAGAATSPKRSDLYFLRVVMGRGGDTESHKGQSDEALPA